MKRTASFLLAVCTLLSLLTFAGCKSDPSPAAQFEEVLDKTFGDDTVTDPLNGHDSVCVALTYRPTEDTALLLEGLGEVTLRTYADKNGTSALLLDAALMEETANLALYDSDGTLVVTSDLLGDTAYGATPMALFQLLMTANVQQSRPVQTEKIPVDSTRQFAPATDEDESTPAWLALATALLSDPDFGPIVEPYLSMIKEAVNTDIDTSLKTDENGISSFSFTFNNDSAKKILKELFNEAKDDDDLRDYLSELVASVSPDEVESALAEYDAFFEDVNSLTDLFALIDEVPFLLTVTAEADGEDTLTACEIILAYESEEEGTRLTFYYDTKTVGESKVGFRAETCAAGTENYNLDTDVALLLQVTENSDKRCAAALKLSLETSEMSTTLNLLTLDYDKTSGDYTLSLPILGRLLFGIEQEIVLKGNYKETENGATATVTQLLFPNTITGVGTTEYELDVTLTVTYDVEMPKAPETYKDVTALTEEDLAALEEAFTAHPLVRLFFDEAKDEAPIESLSLS